MRMWYLDPRLRCRLISVLAITANQVVGGAIVLERGFGRTFEFRNDALRQDLAQLNAPLIERIDVPDDTLCENRVLVESNELAQRLRREPLSHDGVRRAIAFKDAVRHQPIWRAFSLHLLGRLAKGERFCLREDIRQQHVVVTPQRIQRLGEGDEVARNEARALMDQLVERMLPVSPWLAPVDGRGIGADWLACKGDVLPVTLHGHLLKIRRETLQVLLVRENGDGLRA